MALKTTTVRQKVIVEASPEQVYDALTDEVKHSAFTGSKATCEARVGGNFTAWDGYISGKNLELKHGEKIVQEWKTSEWPKGYPPSRLLLNLKKLKTGTQIFMVHSNVPAEQAADIKNGWTEFYWKPLKHYFKTKAQ
jgi:activator of HSP90 ATPase